VPNSGPEYWPWITAVLDIEPTTIILKGFVVSRASATGGIVVQGLVKERLCKRRIQASQASRAMIGTETSKKDAWAGEIAEDEAEQRLT
jgi:hypothetical protein